MSMAAFTLMLVFVAAAVPGAPTEVVLLAVIYFMAFALRKTVLLFGPRSSA